MDAENYKLKLARKQKLKKLPKNIELNLKEGRKLVTKPGRTISGVAPVAIMTKPMECPHGSCVFCPGGVNSAFGTVPKSYTGNEPASMRAMRNKYEGYLQVFNRLEHYVLLQQIPEKVELIIMGGTFLAYSEKYQEEFVKEGLQAMNDFSELFFKKGGLDLKKFKEFFEFGLEFKSEERTGLVQEKIWKLKKETTLEKEQERNEKARIKCVALVIETKPDWCKEKDINQALKLGVTRVEIGVQSLDNEILKKVNRGHTIEESVKATQLLKDAGLKVVYHLMPGLPGSSKEKDIEMIKEVFSNWNFRPDGLKIYPCMVMPGTRLERWHERGEFKPIKTEEAAEIISEGKKFIPEYCRIYRIQRDIPTKFTKDGVGITNLRQYVHELMANRNERCRCIRCREPRDKVIDWKKVKLKRIEYGANGGKEIFLSIEESKQDILLGFLRLRIPYKPFREEINSDSALIRELHVYGPAARIGAKGKIQHRGLGERLLKKAEQIAKKEFKKKIVITSGIGVREYFKRFKYKKEGPYMVKLLGKV